MKSRPHRLPTISDTPDDWVDESWTVDCVCGVNFDDGEEMVDCDECGVWVHTRCSRYVKSEKLFACDKCKSKKLRKESEETEVAQLLVELPTKTLRMESPQNPFHVWTEIPVEEKVHVQGMPGGDPALFHGVSSVFSPELWRCTGYVPKKFNFQYREFPCWDDANKSKQEIDILPPAVPTFAAIKPQVHGGCGLDVKKQEKKDDSGVFEGVSKKKTAKAVDKEGVSKKRERHSFESVSTTSSDAKQSESNEGKGPKALKTDKKSCKHENSRVDVQADSRVDLVNTNNNPFSSGQPFDGSRLNPPKVAKQMEENDGNETLPSVEISPQTEDGMASSLIHNPTETITMKDEVAHDVDDANDNRTQSHLDSSPPNDGSLAPLQPIEVKPAEINHPEKTCDLKLAQEADPQVHKEQNVDKSTPATDESPSQPKGHIKASETSTVARNSSEFKPSGAPNQHKLAVSSSVGKPSTSSAVPSNNNNNSSSKSKKDNASSEVPQNGDSCERPKKLLKDPPKSSHAPVSKKNSSDSKDPAIVSSSKTTESGDTANSLRSGSEVSLRGEKMSQLNANSLRSGSEVPLRGEKMSQLNRQPAPKNHLPHVHPPAPTNSPATLSDEELALLLHQELNSSPRVPRVPRMRHAGSLPQLASTTSTSTLMKRTSTSGGKDNGLVLRKKHKDLASNSREFDGSRKVDRLPSLPTSRRHDPVKSASAKATHAAPPGSTTASSGPSSSTEANEHKMSSTRNSPHNASDDETGPTHRTLPGLIAEIMSKGKRMTYEELCNAVLPHWPNLRKHNGERYAYSSHSQAVLDCLRNRSEWSRLVDRGPKTNAGRKRRRSEADAPNVESEEEEEEEEFPKGKRKHGRRLALHGRLRRRRSDSSSDSSEESVFSDQLVNEASASSDEMGIGTIS